MKSNKYKMAYKRMHDYLHRSKCWRCGKTLTPLEEKACEVGNIEKPTCSACAFDIGVETGWIKLKEEEKEE